MSTPNCQECGEEPGKLYDDGPEWPLRKGGSLYEFGGLILCRDCMDREFGPWDD